MEKLEADIYHAITITGSVYDQLPKGELKSQAMAQLSEILDRYQKGRIK